MPISKRLMRIFKHKTWGDAWALTPWNRLRVKGNRYPQESPTGYAWVCSWVHLRTGIRTQAGRVWLNGEGIEIRHRWESPLGHCWPHVSGGNGNGYSQWRFRRRKPGGEFYPFFKFNKGDLYFEAAKQRKECEKHLRAWLRGEDK